MKCEEFISHMCNDELNFGGVLSHWFGIEFKQLICITSLIIGIKG